MSIGGARNEQLSFNHEFAMQIIESKGEWIDVPGDPAEKSVCLVGEPVQRGRWHDFLIKVAGNDSGKRLELGYFRVGGAVGGNYIASHVADSFENVYNPRASRAEYEANLVFTHVHRLWRLDGTPRPPEAGAAH